MAESSDSSVSLNNINTQKEKAALVQSECAQDEKTDKVLLVEEIKTEVYPESFVNLLGELWKRGETLSANDIIVCLVYLLMLEEGFVPATFEDEDHKSLTFDLRQVLAMSVRIPQDWKRSDILYQMDFVLPGFPKDLCRIICTNSLDDLIINSAAVGFYYSILVDAGLYIIDAGPRRLYQNIRLFAVKFKNEISNLAKADILRKNQRIVSATLQDLPLDLKINFKKYFKIDILRDLEIF